MKRGFCLIGVAALLAACSGGGGDASGDAAVKEDPAEQGAADIARKADEAVKQKVNEFDAQIARDMTEPELEPVEKAASSTETKVDEKSE